MKRASWVLVSVASLAAAATIGCGSSSSGGSAATGAGGSSAVGAGGSLAAGGASVGGAAGQSVGGAAGTGAGGGKAGSGGASAGAAGANAGGASAGAAGANTGGASAGAAGASAGAAGASAGAAGASGASGGAAGGGGSGGSSGGTPTPIFCPVADPFAPNLPANAVLVQDAVLPADAHWTKDKVYLVGQHLEITKHKLTIDAGTIVCLYQQGAISVGEIDPGEIHFNGTPSEHVVITTTADANDPKKPAAFHGGVSLNNWNGSSLSYLDIWYGGPGGGSGAFAFSLPGTSGNGTNKGFLVDHLTLGMLQTRGLEIGTQNGIDAASNIHITGYAPVDPNGPALYEVVNAEVRALTNLTSTNLVIDAANVPAASRWIKIETNVTPGEIDRNAELHDLGVPYQYLGALSVVDVSGGTTPTWTIHEGVTLQLDTGISTGYFPASAKGNLVVLGTPQKPVIFTSNAATPAAGDWYGLTFGDGLFDAGITKLDNLHILYAGNANGVYASRCGEQVHGVITIGGSGSYAGPAISNTLIAHSPTNGIVSSANQNGAKLTTDYAADASITFMDIAMMSYVTGGCMLLARGRRNARGDPQWAPRVVQRVVSDTTLDTGVTKSSESPV